MYSSKVNIEKDTYIVGTCFVLVILVIFNWTNLYQSERTQTYSYMFKRYVWTSVQYSLLFSPYRKRHSMLIDFKFL